MALNPADFADLRRARAMLENPGVVMKVTNLIGLPVEKVFEVLPKGVARLVSGSTRAVLRAMLAVAAWTLSSRRTRPSTNGLHQFLATSSGAIGGFFGLLALPIELPVSTILMLRSIADIARSEGEDLWTQEARAACIQVFALGGSSVGDDAAETGYFAVRALLARTVGEAAEFVLEKGIVQEGAPALVRFIAAVASRTSVSVSEKALLQAIPVIGAVGGAGVNLLFITHFQRMARGHFIVRRLERTYGAEVVRNTYDAVEVKAIVAPPRIA